MLKLVPVKEERQAARLLYDWLQDRLGQPHINISHQLMPTWQQHLRFVHSHPYQVWVLIGNARWLSWFGIALFRR